jgi:hypothetical protein
MNTQKNSYNVGIDIWGKLKELEDFIIKWVIEMKKK